MKPVIYQMLPRLFGNLNPDCVPGGSLEQNGSGKFNDITPDVLESIKGLGATHVWYTGVIEHATATDHSAHGITPDDPHVVKGKAGSPYAIKDYYDVDPDLAVDPSRRREEWRDLVRRTHEAGLKVVIDFVPNHTARRYHSDAAPAGVTDFGTGDDTSLYFGHDNNYYYIPRQLFAPQGVDMGSYREFPAKATGNDCFTAFPGVNDWYDTAKLNYGVDHGDGSLHFRPVPDTWKRMLAILMYWAAQGVDAFRCDMVHMVPLDFWEWAVPAVKAAYPGVQFIAEIYDVALYRPYIERGGFDYLYDKVTLYDTLRGIVGGDISAAQLTSCWQTVEGIADHMLHFLENHDEQRIGSRFFAADPAKGLAPMAVSAFIDRGAVMLYMGQELGERGDDAEGYSGLDGRTTLFDYWSLETLRRWLSPDGVPDEGRLSPQQRWLRRSYARILELCNTVPALRDGAFYDLMYVNYDNPRFNPHRHYAFLRHTAGEVVLVVANFDDEAADVEVNLPAHAFVCMGLPERPEASAEELLEGRRSVLPFTSRRPVPVHVPARGAVAWRMKRR